MRLIVLVALIPQITIGVFGGTTFLAHNHDHHELHLHTAGSTPGVELSTPVELSITTNHDADHAGAHGSFDGWASADTHDLDYDLTGSHCPNGRQQSEDCPDNQTPADVKISIPDLDQRLGRSLELERALSSVAVVALVGFTLQSLSHADQPSGSLEGLSSVQRLDICGLHAVERLMRTSGSLLI